MKLPEDIKTGIIKALEPLDPYRVILFGSYAYGNPTEESDIDLYIVTKDDFIPQNWRDKRDMVRKVSKQIHSLREIYSIDLLVHTKAMHEKFIETGSCFSKEITESGEPLI